MTEHVLTIDCGAVRRAVEDGSRFLLSRQDRDGAWRDFSLPGVGSSDEWITAYTGFALARAVDEYSGSATERARLYLAATRKADGWGYSARAGADADSTAWALRLLAPSDGWRRLLRYLDNGGRARTYVRRPYGAWVDSHADVTPVVGLALLATRAPPWIIARVRAACLDAQSADGGWSAFWWRANGYAVARNLEFLVAAGGLGPALRGARGWLLGAAAPRSTFEAANLVEARILAGIPTADLVDQLLAGQQPGGGWSSSRELVLHPNRTSWAGEPYADHRRIHSTAAALLALSRLPGR